MLQLFPFRSFSRDSRLVLLLWLAFFRQSSFSHVVLAKRIHMLIRLLNKMNKKNGSKKKYNKKTMFFPFSVHCLCCGSYRKIIFGPTTESIVFIIWKFVCVWQIIEPSHNKRNSIHCTMISPRQKKYHTMCGVCIRMVNAKFNEKNKRHT